MSKPKRGRESLARAVGALPPPPRIARPTPASPAKHPTMQPLKASPVHPQRVSPTRPARFAPLPPGRSAPSIGLPSTSVAARLGGIRRGKTAPRRQSPRDV
jgi:hypothetical protein